MATYTVKFGESLSKIARDVLGDMSRWPEIAQLNNIASPYVIQTGQILQLPDATDDENSIFYKGAAGKGEPTPTAPTTAPTRAAVDVNWPLIALAIAGVGLLWYGFKK